MRISCITFCSCFQDILTDFSVEAEKIPLDGGDADWFGHKVCETYEACGTKFGKCTVYALISNGERNMMSLRTAGGMGGLLK